MKKLRRSRKAQQRARELQQEKAGGEEKQQPPATPVTDSSVHSAVLQVWPCGDVAAIYASSKLVSAGVTYDKKKTLIQEDDD